MPAGTWRATVARIDGTGRPYVTVPRLNRAHVYGPCAVLEQPGDTLTTGDVTGAATAGTGHTHATTTSPPAPLAAGDRVLVAFIEERDTDPVILGRLRP